MNASKVKNIFQSVKLYLRKTLLVFFPAKRGELRIFLIFFIISSFIWLFNELNKKHRVLLSYPVNIQYNKTNYIAVNQVPEYLLLEIEATGWHILTQYFDFWKKPLDYQIQVKDIPGHNYEIGGYKLKKNIEDGYIYVDIPKESLFSNLKSRVGGVNQNSLENINITLDKFASRKITFDTDLKEIERKLDNAYELEGKININPKFFEAKGPKSWIEQIPDPFIIPLSDGKVTEDFSETVALKLPKQETGKLTTNVEEVAVSFSVVKYQDAIVIVKVKKKNFPEGLNLQLEKEKIRVLCYVPENEMSELKEEDFILEADYKTFNPIESTVELKLLQRPAFIRGKPFYPLRLKVKRK